jgi:hypothetical protein
LVLSAEAGGDDLEFLIHGSLLDFADDITAVGTASITETDGVEQTSEVYGKTYRREDFL